MFTEIRVWITEDPNNGIWQTLRPMHNFGIFCFSLILLLKVQKRSICRLFCVFLWGKGLLVLEKRLLGSDF
jgi:hypothetical protein